MKRHVISLLFGLVLGTLFAIYGLEWLNKLILERWRLVFSILLLISVLLWLFYINIDNITKRVFGTAVPGYSELVEDLFKVIKTSRDKDQRDQFIEYSNDLSKKLASKYSEIRGRRTVLRFMIGFFAVSLGVLNITILSNQNEIMNKQLINEKVSYRISRLESIQRMLKTEGFRDRTANNLLHDYFDDYKSLVDLTNEHDHVIADYYIDLERMRIFDEDIATIDFSDLHLVGLEATSTNFYNVDFSGALLNDVSFENCSFHLCRFDSVQSNKIEFHFCDFDSTSFEGLIIDNGDFNVDYFGSVFRDKEYYGEDINAYATNRDALFDQEDCDRLINRLNSRLDSLTNISTPNHNFWRDSVEIAEHIENLMGIRSQEF